jgi:hypothetical protein
MKYILTTLALAASSLATPVPDSSPAPSSFKITNVVSAGSGCPQGSIDIDWTDNRILPICTVPPFPSPSLQLFPSPPLQTFPSLPSLYTSPFIYPSIPLPITNSTKQTSAEPSPPPSPHTRTPPTRAKTAKSTSNSPSNLASPSVYIPPTTAVGPTSTAA